MTAGATITRTPHGVRARRPQSAGARLKAARTQEARFQPKPPSVASPSSGSASSGAARSQCAAPVASRTPMRSPRPKSAGRFQYQWEGRSAWGQSKSLEFSFDQADDHLDDAWVAGLRESQVKSADRFHSEERSLWGQSWQSRSRQDYSDQADVGWVADASYLQKQKESLAAELRAAKDVLAQAGTDHALAQMRQLTHVSTELQVVQQENLVLRSKLQKSLQWHAEWQNNQMHSQEKKLLVSAARDRQEATVKLNRLEEQLLTEQAANKALDKRLHAEMESSRMQSEEAFMVSCSLEAKWRAELDEADKFRWAELIQMNEKWDQMKENLEKQLLTEQSAHEALQLSLHGEMGRSQYDFDRLQKDLLAEQRANDALQKSLHAERESSTMQSDEAYAIIAGLETKLRVEQEEIQDLQESAATQRQDFFDLYKLDRLQQQQLLTEQAAHEALQKSLLVHAESNKMQSEEAHAIRVSLETKLRVEQDEIKDLQESAARERQEAAAKLDRLEVAVDWIDCQSSEAESSG